MTSTKDPNNELDELREIIERYENEDSDTLAVELQALIDKKVTEARIDERNGMQFFNDDGTVTFKPYGQYRFTGNGLKISWEDRTAELTAQLSKPKEEER